MSARSAEIEEWLGTRVATLLEIPSTNVDSQRDLTDYGLDSEALLELLSGLEDFLDRRLPDTFFLDFRSISAAASEAAKRL